ncbi:MAG: hypothetical protein MJ016_08145, partial [Victivallaceae bacterium]|nr:hypothetical protein [Victivallaceae bacterium]
ARLSRRAAVEYGFKQSERQVNSYIDLGDYDAAHRLIDAYASSENGTPLYSSDQAKTMHTYIDRKQQYNAIAGAAGSPTGKIRIGNEDLDVREALTARKNNGVYLNFPLISEKERDALVKMAKTYADGRDVKLTDNILAARAEGRVLYDNQELKAMHAQGLISGKQYKQYVSWNNTHESAVQKGKDAAWTSAKDQWILDNLYSDAGTEKMLSPGQAEALCVEARELCGGRASECAKLFDLIRKRVAGVQNGNDVLKTARGAQIKEYLEGFDDLAFGFGVGDKPDENTPRNQKTNTIDTTSGFIKEQRAEAYAWAMRTLEEYPDLSAREIINLLDERMKKVRNGVIGRLFDDYEREFIQYGDQQ